MEITKRNDGRYQCKVPIGKDEKGKTMYKVVYGSSKREINEKIKTTILEVKPLSNDSTFSEIMKKRLEFDEPRMSESDFSIKKYRVEHFSAAFIDKKVEEISIDDINAAMLDIYAINPSTGKPSSKRTIIRYLRDVSSVFEFGIQNRLSTYNPCQYVTPPKNAKIKTRDALSEKERNEILSKTDIRYFPAQFLILTGLRRGEATALTWSDIDLKERIIRVTKSYDFKTNQVKSTKTQAGIRNVPITENLYEMILKYKKHFVPIAKYTDDGCLVKTGKKIKPTKPKSTDYFFNGVTCGGRFTETAWNKLLKGLIDEIGFDFDWHSLRHTYASILYEAGVDTLTAKELLGHSDVKTTMGIYTHLSERGKKHSISKLDEFFKCTK